MSQEARQVEIKKHNGKRYITLPLVAVILMLVVVAALFLILWSVKRRRDPVLRVEQPGEIHALLPSIAGLSQGALLGGNRIDVLQNGDGYFPALLQSIAGARQSIHFETFLWQEGRISNQIASALAAKAREGVDVRLLLDGSGGRGASDEEIELMRAAGCQVRSYHPWRISNLGLVNNRNHRKIAVIDGRVGFIGGHCIVDEWTGNGQDKDHFRDTSVRVRGPVVQELQSAFCENWIAETGEVPAGEKYFPPPETAGTTRAHLAYISASGSASSVELLHYLAISAARKQILIQNPYFLPDPSAIEELGKAVKRGVDVRIMLPSVNATDNAIVQHASHHHFGNLLNLGVKIYEYDRTLLHQKTITVDGQWCAIGSTNFDDRSFELNEEASLGIADPAIASQLVATFANDMTSAHEIKLAQWKKRSWLDKLMDAGAYLINEQL